MVTMEKMRRLENGSSSSSQSDLDHQEKAKRVVKRNVLLDDFVSLGTDDSSSEELPSVPHLPSFSKIIGNKCDEKVFDNTEDLDRTVTPEEHMITFSQLLECSLKTTGN